MKRRRAAPLYALGSLLALLVIASALGPGLVERHFNRVFAPPPYPVSERAAALHRSLRIADLHADSLLWGRDPLRRGARGHVDLPRLVEGNVALQVFAAVTKVPRGQNYERNTGDTDALLPLVVLGRWPPAAWSGLTARALFQARRLERAVVRSARSDPRLVAVRSAGELERLLAGDAKGARAVGAVLAIEGLHALDGRIENLDRLAAAGYRIMAPAHFFDNRVAGSAHGVEKGGLTPLGRRVLRRMEELEITVDLAHASPRAFDEVLATARRPVVVSHTGVQATCPGPRNLSDDQLRAVAANGGLVGVGFWPGAICAGNARAIARAVRHAVAVAGVDHVALGSDFDGATVTPFDASGLAVLTEALVAAGFDEREIAAVMGENLLRFLAANLPRT